MARYPQLHRESRGPSSGPFHPSDADEQSIERRVHDFGERPHGWGNYESNYDLAASELRRIDSPASDAYGSERTEARVDHRGKGPRGFKRSDERYQEIACEILTEDPRIDAHDVDVHVQEGELLLTGFVESRRTKFLIEDLLANALDCEITNRLQIRRPQDTSASREVARNWLVD